MTGLPIACTLPPDAYTARQTWIADLNRAYLLAHEERGLVLELRYSLAAAHLLTELVQKESVCCAFLQFERTVTSDAIVLRITTPVEAGASARLILAPFIEGSC
ncbi:MAG: hypothetical protein ABI884_01035 [Gemmatimonadota bacterium]